MAVRVHRITGAGTVVTGKVRVHKITGSGSLVASGKVRVHKITGTGTGVASLSVAKTTFDPGETVSVTVTNPNAGTWSITSPDGAPALLADFTSASFTAPAKKDGTTVTVGYGGQYVTVTITPAFVLVGPTEIPAIVWVNLP